MLISQVAISVDDRIAFGAVRSAYQMKSNYLTLALSECIAALRLNLGQFNRIIFEEGSGEDFKVVGNRAYVVKLVPEFSGLTMLSDARASHEYFVRKYEEGFRRLDEFFKIETWCVMKARLATAFSRDLIYERVMRNISLHGQSFLIVQRYSSDKFELVLRKDNREAEIGQCECILLECDPDPFIVDYDVRCFDVTAGQIHVFDRAGKTTLEYDVSPILRAL